MKAQKDLKKLNKKQSYSIWYIYTTDSVNREKGEEILTQGDSVLLLACFMYCRNDQQQ